MDNNPNNQEIQNQKDEPWQCSLKGQFLKNEVALYRLKIVPIYA